MKSLYFEHVAAKRELFAKIMAEEGCPELLIASGRILFAFQDDQMYPFKANPYFKEWLPLHKRPDCLLRIRDDQPRPELYLHEEEDIWHTAPQELPPGWEQAFSVIRYQSAAELTRLIGPVAERAAYIGQANELGLPAARCNQAPLLTRIDYYRRFKTEYEHSCIREANRLAMPGHLAAREAFLAGASEREIMHAYLGGCRSTETDMPYAVIAALNEHAGTLHHFVLDSRAPQQSRSFLIDAGMDYLGYASDISRTYAFDPQSEFAEMIRLMDQKQQEIAAAGVAGQSNLDLHILSHHKVAEVLAHFQLISGSPEAAVASGVTGAFYPHGIGHGLGVCVHEKGGQLADPQGTPITPPPLFQRLRNTAQIVATQVHTIEPGLYFIPPLLDKLKTTAQGRAVNWTRVEEFIPYGGIRIEDNLVVHRDGRLENLTRDAFATAS